MSEHSSCICCVHDEGKAQKANAGRLFACFGRILKTCHSAVSKKTLCSKESQLDSRRMPADRCGSEMQLHTLHRHMESRMRNSNAMQSTREQNFFSWGKQEHSSPGLAGRVKNTNRRGKHIEHTVCTSTSDQKRWLEGSSREGATKGIPKELQGNSELCEAELFLSVAPQALRSNWKHQQHSGCREGGEKREPRDHWQSMCLAANASISSLEHAFHSTEQEQKCPMQRKPLHTRQKCPYTQLNSPYTFTLLMPSAS